MRNEKKIKKGIVYIVGAGPGDPGLLTLRGAVLLARADVVIYDGLVNRELLDLAPEAEKIYVGKIKQLPRAVWTEFRRVKKRPEQTCVHLKDRPSIEEISRLMADRSRSGKAVVRLKGGDPFVFGRGSEEAAYLQKWGIDFEIVSGVSAGYSVPASAGIPVTDRRASSLVTFVTAHEMPEKRRSSVHWNLLAKLGGTLVSFMGVQSLPIMVKGLIGGGRPPSTLVSVIQWGTIRRQRVVEGTLGDIVQRVQKKKLGSPAIAVVGEVNRFRRELEWFEKRPRSKGLPQLLSDFKRHINSKYGR